MPSSPPLPATGPVKVTYHDANKPHAPEVFIYAESAQAVKDYLAEPRPNGPPRPALIDTVQSFSVYQNADNNRGNNGMAIKAPSAVIADLFGDRKEDEIIEMILKEGRVISIGKGWEKGGVGIRLAH
ncbi:hypothetical protein CXG81DRAFT_16322 [Caulochytrium protostelioides]|uniref:Ribosome maturation protein SDO1/SBDS N-terminal domain-containing protein n=1 Tax=Caulochytrium protostelioides TaxID=1555241 RepID=A0A4P9WW34_9FUNG|nr:hypothetical protein CAUPRSCDRAFT_10718 [Caulochytrium protostelioides]RKP04355.1 hypothetical protein CXG81DRAFT_16322 [Caulochytrium protostelioides]|eukprot:RKP04355.1 hypothetical protein CXG81DRAFT_16322 [Caulochytrium protostelioides]